MEGGQSEVSSLIIEEFGDFSEIETTEDLQDISLLEQDKDISDKFVFARKRHMFKSSEIQLIEELERCTQSPHSVNLEVIDTIR